MIEIIYNLIYGLQESETFRFNYLSKSLPWVKKVKIFQITFFVITLILLSVLDTSIIFL